MNAIVTTEFYHSNDSFDVICEVKIVKTISFLRDIKSHTQRMYGKITKPI